MDAVTDGGSFLRSRKKLLRSWRCVHQLKTNHLAGQSYNHLHLRNDTQAKFKQIWQCTKLRGRQKL